MGLGPAQQYLAQFNTYVLPGYVQDESFTSDLNVATHYAAYRDGSNSEITGLANKPLTVRLKVWEQDYATVKDQILLAGTILRSKRDGFGDLYLQYTDRYYPAIPKSVKYDKSVGSSTKIGEYTVDFECKPWLVSVSGYSISGTGTLDTDTVGRTIADGGWTPTVVTVTGTDITISGYTATGDYAGFISVSGAVSNLVIDTEGYSATIGGVNYNSVMDFADYQLYVGPARTYYDITGASSTTISWNNRWYI